MIVAFPIHPVDSEAAESTSESECSDEDSASICERHAVFLKVSLGVSVIMGMHCQN